jgi:hypothetical protein
MRFFRPPMSLPVSAGNAVDELEVAFAVLAAAGGADGDRGEVPGHLDAVRRPADDLRVRVLGDLPVDLAEREPAAVFLVEPQPEVLGVELLRPPASVNAVELLLAGTTA